MNKCQHCATELENKRAKNCSICSALLNEAHRKGSYDLAMEAIFGGKQAGLSGTDLQQVIKDATTAGRERANERINEYRQREQDRRERDSRNIAFYQANGYFPNAGDNDEDTRKDIEEARSHRVINPTEPEIYG